MTLDSHLKDPIKQTDTSDIITSYILCSENNEESIQQMFSSLILGHYIKPCFHEQVFL